MPLRAVLRDGREVVVDPSHGETLAELVTGLTSGSLTGSAVPLAEATIRVLDGDPVAYAEVNTFLEDRPFR